MNEAQMKRLNKAQLMEVPQGLHNPGMFMYRTGYNRLMAVHVAHIKVPRYHGTTLWFLVKQLRYHAFVKDVNQKNQNIVITRPEMDSCWMQLLVKKFQTTDLSGPEYDSPEGYDRLYVATYTVLHGGLLQRYSEESEKYWEEMAAKHPGLDVSSPPDDSDADHAYQSDPDFSDDSDDGDDMKVEENEAREAETPEDGNEGLDMQEMKQALDENAMDMD